MKIINVNSLDQARALCGGDFPDHALIFKHSPRCSISNMAWDRFNRNESKLPADFPVYLVNVLTDRDSSMYFAEHFKIEHASPQIILVKNGSCVLTESHNGIDAGEIANNI